MTTMNVSLPDELRSFVDAQVNEGSFGSTSEYVRELIRQRRIKAFKEGRRGGYRVTEDAIGDYIKSKYEEQNEVEHKDKTGEDKDKREETANQQKGDGK